METPLYLGARACGTIHLKSLQKLRWSKLDSRARKPLAVTPNTEVEKRGSWRVS